MRTLWISIAVFLGMSPANAIRAGTIRNAELLGLSAPVGSVARGKFADIIAVDGNPLEDVTALERVKFVMKDGKLIRNGRP